MLIAVISYFPYVFFVCAFHSQSSAKQLWPVNGYRYFYTYSAYLEVLMDTRLSGPSVRNGFVQLSESPKNYIGRTDRTRFYPKWVSDIRTFFSFRNISDIFRTDGHGHHHIGKIATFTTKGDSWNYNFEMK